jgi:hypothetical protein
MTVFQFPAQKKKKKKRKKEEKAAVLSSKSFQSNKQIKT